MKLIIESGSTKTEWVIIQDGEIKTRSMTDGINPLMQSAESISDTIKKQLADSFFVNEYASVHYYGAGCVSDEVKRTINDILSETFFVTASVDTDLLAAARSLLQHEKGIACILGTGSNSCFYDGHEIIKNVRSLGYILGDEGSGSVLGKMFLGDCLKGLAPDDITQSFFSTYSLTYEQLITRIYKEPYPNRFLASLSEFLNTHIGHEYVHGLVYANFELFFKRCISQYNHEQYPLAFTGSIAYYYKDILTEVAEQYGAQISKILKSPLIGLVEYHS